MKKSKIIVPALALLLLSTAATVSGSVAWFTANRTFTTNINDFQVANTEGNLAVVMNGGVRTTAASGNQSVSIDSGTILGDASLNHTTGELFTDTVVSSSFKSLGTYTAAEADTTKWLVGGSTYYAVSWEMQFKYEFAADLTQQNLYLDPTSTMTPGTVTKEAQNGSSADASKGFRIAFIGETATYTSKKVWSDLATDAEMQEFDYVASTSAKGNYSGDIISTDDTNGTSGLVSSSSTTGSTSAANYLGNFNSAAKDANNIATITFGCVAWFEGCDTTNVINDAVFKKINTTMKFLVVPNA